MRGRSSNAKSRLRSAGYKCNLCGRRLIDAATLERHRKNIHNISSRDTRVTYKAKPPVQRKLSNKEKDKIFDELLKDRNLGEEPPRLRASRNNYEDLRNTESGKLPDGGKIITNEVEHVNNGDSLLVEKDKSNKKEKGLSRRVEFECPVCPKTFSVYFTAHKHIQKAHSVNADGKKVAPNALDLVQPIRVEHCYKCNSIMRSNELHLCPQMTLMEDVVSIASEYVCTGCNQIFVSLKSFDMHVAGLHSDAVESMFFPTKIEFMNWRLEMERETNVKYSLYGEYESKKIYRCNYARKDGLHDRYTAYFCPASMVVQDFSKGIQVHFYYKHYEHKACHYNLSSKYRKYSITSFLTYPDDDDSTSTDTRAKTLEDKDLHSQFKKLMDGIVLNTVDIDVPLLKTLIEKALEMSTVLTDAVSDTATVLKPAKKMTDKEITEALEPKTVLRKRRRSVDSGDPTPKASKRTRNKSLYNQTDIRMSPKILNTFSLASNSNSDEFKSDIGDDFDFESTVNIDNNKTGVNENKNVSGSDIKSNKTKVNTKTTSFNESLSFNDSYKDFIDKNFIAKSDAGKDLKSARSTVKTKLGSMKHTSPKQIDNKSDNDTATDKIGIKSMSPFSTNIDETPDSNENIIDMNAGVHILSDETTNVSAVKTDTHKANNRGALPQLLDPLEVNLTKVNRRYSSSSQVDSPQGIASKVNTRSGSSSLADPLELNITKGKVRNVLKDPMQRKASKNSRSVTPTADPLKTSSTKINMTKIQTAKLNSNKTDGSKLNTVKVYPAKFSSNKPPPHKVYSGPGSHKVNSPAVAKTAKVNTPGLTKTTSLNNPGLIKPASRPNSPVISSIVSRITFENEPSTTVSRPNIPHRKIKELKYEIREQENDCNILVFKL